jgi:hypothetical protein
MSKPTLVFVYNADSGLFNLLSDFFQKIFSPENYSCSLCALTYSPLGMRGRWKKFVRGLGHSLEFLHRDELKNRYGMEDVQLPAIFLRRKETLDLWIDTSALDKCGHLEDLEGLILQKLAGPSSP